MSPESLLLGLSKKILVFVVIILLHSWCTPRFCFFHRTQNGPNIHLWCRAQCVNWILDLVKVRNNYFKKILWKTETQIYNNSVSITITIFWVSGDPLVDKGHNFPKTLHHYLNFNSSLSALYFINFLFLCSIVSNYTSQDRVRETRQGYHAQNEQAWYL